MSYDHWKTRTPDHAQVYDSGPCPSWPRCRDCGALEGEHMHHCPTGSYCDPCWSWRTAHGVEFDARTIDKVRAAVA